MGGDREANPSVTAEVTRNVAYLARWIASDMYLREIDALRFEATKQIIETVYSLLMFVVVDEQMQLLFVEDSAADC